MKRAASILVLVLVVSVLSASDVRGGAALVRPGKTSAPALTAAIVIDVTGGFGAEGKGLASIRVEKGRRSTAALFYSSYVNSFAAECLRDSLPGTTLETSTNIRFIGFMDGWVDEFVEPPVLVSLIGPLLDQLGKDKDPLKAAITDIDDVSCTTVTRLDPTTGSPSVRQVLSFTAVIRFGKD